MPNILSILQLFCNRYAFYTCTSLLCISYTINKEDVRNLARNCLENSLRQGFGSGRMITGSILPGPDGSGYSLPAKLDNSNSWFDLHCSFSFVLLTSFLALLFLTANIQARFFWLFCYCQLESNFFLW